MHGDIGGERRWAGTISNGIERERVREGGGETVAASSKVDVYRFRGEGRFTISGIRGSPVFHLSVLSLAPSFLIRLLENN